MDLVKELGMDLMIEFFFGNILIKLIYIKFGVDKGICMINLD